MRSSNTVRYSTYPCCDTERCLKRRESDSSARIHISFAEPANVHRTTISISKARLAVCEDRRAAEEIDIWGDDFEEHTGAFGGDCEQEP